MKSAATIRTIQTVALVDLGRPEAGSPWDSKPTKSATVTAYPLLDDTDIITSGMPFAKLSPG
jgi:hypothetical protein